MTLANFHTLGMRDELIHLRNKLVTQKTKLLLSANARSNLRCTLSGPTLL
jgi:hypothetical protein